MNREQRGRAPQEPRSAREAAATAFGEDSEQLVYGRNAVSELLKSGVGVDTVYVSETMQEAVAAYYTALAKDVGAVVKRIHPAKLSAMTGGENHQGVACWASPIEYVEVEDMLRAAAGRGEDPLLLLADGVEDPHNLGAILRTALLCGAHGVVIPRRGGVGITPAVVKASAGASAVLPIARVANIGQTVRSLKEKNIFVYCAQMGGSVPYKQDLTGPLALVVGSEGKGVSPLVQKLCDVTLSVPMAARNTGVDSFNVSVAAGMLLYEVGRQRALKAASSAVLP